MYLSKLPYVFVQIATCICLNCKCICPKKVLAGLCHWSSDETNLLPRVIWHQRNVASFRPALYKHWRAWWQQLGQAEEAMMLKNGVRRSWARRYFCKSSLGTTGFSNEWICDWGIQRIFYSIQAMYIVTSPKGQNNRRRRRRGISSVSESYESVGTSLEISSLSLLCIFLSSLYLLCIVNLTYAFCPFPPRTSTFARPHQ